MQRPERSGYTAVDFMEWRNSGSLDTTPEFQRRSVWKTPAKSYLMDSLLREMPVPPVYLRRRYDAKSKKTIREVLDGQQRINAVLDFIDGKYRLSGTLDAPWKKKNFNELDAQQQERIRTYSFNAEIFDGISDEEVLAVFARLNTYSVPLNKQELRNGNYFGHFKQTAYSLAYEHLEFWRRHKIFSDTSIARMLEVELTSELMIAQLAGMQDKKKSIDKFYNDFDETFQQKSRIESHFRGVIDSITESLGDSLRDSEFRKPPMFYTLFCVVFHREHGLAGAAVQTGKKKLNRVDSQNLRDAVTKLSDVLLTARETETIPTRYSKFIAACLSQTDNVGPRSKRFMELYKKAFS